MRTMPLLGSVLLVVCYASVGCGDDTTDPTGSGGGTSGAGAGDTGGSTGSGGPVQTCDQLCALAESTTPSQDSCVASFVKGRGYPSDSTLSCQALVVTKTETQCDACYGDIDITDANCEAAHQACF
jgi:hypothetical protein